MNFAQVIEKVKIAISRAWQRLKASSSKVEAVRMFNGLKASARLMRTGVLSLRTMRFSPEDPSLLWISAVAFMILQAAISGLLWQVDSPWAIISHQLSLDLDDFLVQRDNWGPEKIQIYLRHYWLDFFHPAVYAIFFRCLLTRIQISFPTQYLYHCLAFPVAAGIYDEIENICQLIIMAGWTESKFVFFIGALGAYFKWLLLLAAFAAAAHAVIKTKWELYLEK